MHAYPVYLSKTRYQEQQRRGRSPKTLSIEQMLQIQACSWETQQTKRPAQSLRPSFVSHDLPMPHSVYVAIGQSLESRWTGEV